MKIARVFSVLIASVLSVAAVEVGDTYAEVIAEKGQPTARLEAGTTMVLNYPDGRIKLKGGKVVEVNSKLPEAMSAPEEPVAPAAAPGAWTTQYAAALRQARQQDAKVFLFFTGSDWCGWCKRLDREVLTTDKFRDYAGKNLVLVKLDFPRGVAQSSAEKAQNEQLAQRYQVRGFPTVVVLNAAGKEVGRLGYQPGGPGPFIDAVKKL
jgi:thiol-disulfide isomerase/thioredoxin